MLLLAIIPLVFLSVTSANENLCNSYRIQQCYRNSLLLCTGSDKIELRSDSARDVCTRTMRKLKCIRDDITNQCKDDTCAIRFITTAKLELSPSKNWRLYDECFNLRKWIATLEPKTQQQD
ncbi:hypothetical protein DdX_18005 [Ditylenchus destructor]|uniref:Uncharacterized protein n=1 Tax=Ditylenchus destructor TaxID=166010 RepID=A0AAD4QT34_9BILA|nr:hypothetical protein DdX_18005 [Ditylenchus destructor]